MKKIKNKMATLCLVGFSMVLPLMSTTSLTSCSSRKYKILKQIVPYLHYIEFDNYNEVQNNYNPKSSDYDLDGFGCSCVRNGDFFGRNLDYYYNETPYFITRVNNNGKHFASIGVCYNKSLLEDDIVKEEKSRHYDHDLDSIPNRTTDGINENGVVCAMNVCSKKDAGNTGAPKYDSTDLDLSCAVRYVLDHAKSAEDAVELLEQKNLYINSQTTPYNLHLMVADKKDTYILELFNDDGSTTQPPRLHSPSRLIENQQMMTNFYVNMSADRLVKTWDGIAEPKEDPHTHRILNIEAQGTERYQILHERYALCKTFSGMYETLKSAWMSNIYSRYDRASWPSEDVFQDVITDEQKFASWQNSKEEIWDPKRETHGYKWLYEDYHDIMLRQDRKLGNTHDVWITNHTAIFNFIDKTMWLIPEEHYALSYKFSV